MQETYQTGIILTEHERGIVDRHVQKLGLGQRGFSAALRIIIREWAEANQPHLAEQPQTDRYSKPDPNIAVEEALKSAEETTK